MVYAASNAVPGRNDAVQRSAGYDLDDRRKAAVRGQLESILRSPLFCSSERMKRFLALVVSETLAGRAQQLKEYTIGVDAFERPPTFSPVADPIVRVEARRLREKLARYYQEHGGRDAIVIEVPRGQYVPSFTFRTDSCSPAAGETALTVRRFSSVPAKAEAVTEALRHELLDQFVRVHGVCVRTAEEPSSALLLSGCVEMFGRRTRVVAYLTSAPQFECRWSTAVASDASIASAQSVAAVIASSVVEYLSREQVRFRSRQVNTVR